MNFEKDFERGDMNFERDFKLGEANKHRAVQWRNITGATKGLRWVLHLGRELHENRPVNGKKKRRTNDFDKYA